MRLPYAPTEAWNLFFAGEDLLNLVDMRIKRIKTGDAYIRK